MSDNQIGVWKSPHSDAWFWQHADCDLPSVLCTGISYTAGDAADAGREHMRRVHYDKEAVVSAALDDWAAEHPEADGGGYSRACGVSLAACEAQTCRCVDPDAENGPHRAAQRLDCEGLVCGFHPCQCEDAVQRFDPPCDFPCCCDHPHCRAHGNPLQTAHNEGVRR